MPAKRLKEYLDSNNIRYVSVTHSQSFTAQEIAESSHISGREMAKTVIVKLDGKAAVVVLPATRRIDFDLLKAAAGTRKVDLATEEEFVSMFPDCEVGAMPPFGNLYGLAVFVDESLTADEQIAFNAGTHKELIKVAYRDFAKLVDPKVAKLSSAA